MTKPKRNLTADNVLRISCCGWLVGGEYRPGQTIDITPDMLHKTVGFTSKPYKLVNGRWHRIRDPEFEVTNGPRSA